MENTINKKICFRDRVLSAKYEANEMAVRRTNTSRNSRPSDRGSGAVVNGRV
jgi:hypothetical protein